MLAMLHLLLITTQARARTVAVTSEYDANGIYLQMFKEENQASARGRLMRVQSDVGVSQGAWVTQAQAVQDVLATKKAHRGTASIHSDPVAAADKRSVELTTALLISFVTGVLFMSLFIYLMMCFRQDPAPRSEQSSSPHWRNQNHGCIDVTHDLLEYRKWEAPLYIDVEIARRIPRVNDASTFHEARNLLRMLGGWKAMRKELMVSGFLGEDKEELTLGDQPLNMFARVAAGITTQANMGWEQQALGKFQNRFVIVKNRPGCDMHWDSKDPKWTRAAAMAKCHRILTTKNLHWQWFNPVVFGLVPLSMDGYDLRSALKEVEDMRSAALTYVQNTKQFGDKVGLYVNCYGHCEVNSLHVHILDMQNLGQAFELHKYKNCPLDAVIEVLQEEVAAADEMGTNSMMGTSSMMMTTTTTASVSGTETIPMAIPRVMIGREATERCEQSSSYERDT